jgi:voltage-gated potassium channel
MPLQKQKLWKENMTELHKSMSVNPLVQRLIRVWPQVPLGLFLFFVGAINVLTGIQSHAFSPAFQVLTSVTPLSELSKEISLGLLGSSVQVLLGAGLLLTGMGLLWRLRSAWAFSILLLVIAIILDLFNQRDIYGVLLSGLALTALVIWKRRFNRRSLLGGYLMSFIGLLAVLAYGVLGSLLLGSSFAPAIQDIYTALYFTVVTLSTVGRNIYPSMLEAQLFMVTLILGGISIFTTTIVTTLGPLLTNQIRPILDGKSTKRDSVDRVILLGADPFIESIIHELTELGIDAIQVVASSEVLTDKERPVIYGNPSNEDVLEQAGISLASAVVIVGEYPADKIATVESVKKLNSSARLVVVSNSVQAFTEFSPVPADLVFSPETVAARVLVNLLVNDSVPKGLRNIITVN